MVVGPRTAVITIVSGRHDHLQAQQHSLAIGVVNPDHYVVVAMGDPEVAAVTATCPDLPADVISVQADPRQLPLAAARNAGAAHAIDAGAELLIFLDVDCIASPQLVERYQAVAARNGMARSVMSGTVRYLPPPPPAGYDAVFCRRHGRPHSARPVPKPTELVAQVDPDLFWSLSFAVPSGTWQHLGGFCEGYVGYGGEDTDFAAIVDREGIAMWWLGGADAYHQHHPSSNPPVDHLDDILRNAATFHRRWGRWPMKGWLDQFREAQLAHLDEEGRWVVGPQTAHTGLVSADGSATT